MITRHIPISGMLVCGEINNMELNLWMSNTKREHIDPENRQWPRSTAQSSSWWPWCFADAGVSVQGSRFPMASQSQLVSEAAWKTILVPPPLRSLCLPRLASSGGLPALPIPRCFSRGHRNSVVMPLLVAVVFLTYLVSHFNQHQFPPSVNSLRSPLPIGTSVLTILYITLCPILLLHFCFYPR